MTAITIDDLQAMEFEELRTLVQLVTDAVMTKADRALDSAKRQRQELLAFEPQIEKCFATKPVKLNVGGTYFSIGMENLTSEPNTFFAAMFSGRWEVPVDPKDDAVFIDRDPAVFGIILNYLRTGAIDPHTLTLRQREALRKEADFYRITPLLNKIPRPAFCGLFIGALELSENGSRVSSAKLGKTSIVVSSMPFSADVQEMTVKLVKGRYLLFGVAPKSIAEPCVQWKEHGWFVWDINGSAYGRDHDDMIFGYKINEGDIVAVKLDSEFNISFAVNGEDWGVAFKAVAKDYSTPLHLAIAFVDPTNPRSESTTHERIVELL